MNRKSIYLVCLTIFPFMVGSGVIYSVLSLYFAELGASKSQVGLIYTTGAIAAAVTAPLWGKASDRLGRRRVLLGSMGLFSMVFLGYALSTHYRQLFLVQVGEGIAWAALGASAMALIADLAPTEERGQAMGIYNTAWSIGWIVGPCLGGFLTDYLGFKPAFLICVGMTLGGMALGVLLLPRR
ncbi:MAG: MFS transporter [Candidatus Latescibacterota bacterium]|nr:MAG: MFS transporter [Candidatus Latescibacterota bacterium]